MNDQNGKIPNDTFEKEPFGVSGNLSCTKSIILIYRQLGVLCTQQCKFNFKPDERLKSDN